jgi:hypothetical protein
MRTASDPLRASSTGSACETGLLTVRRKRETALHSRCSYRAWRPRSRLPTQAAAHCWITPDAAVGGVPLRLLLLCLLFRSSWLTVEGERHVGAAGVLDRRADGQPWPSESMRLLAFRTSSLACADLVSGACCM